jgi:hypothetical protein
MAFVQFGVPFASRWWHWPTGKTRREPVVFAAGAAAGFRPDRLLFFAIAGFSLGFVRRGSFARGRLPEYVATRRVYRRCARRFLVEVARVARLEWSARAR